MQESKAARPSPLVFQHPRGEYSDLVHGVRNAETFFLSSGRTSRCESGGAVPELPGAERIVTVSVPIQPLYDRAARGRAMLTRTYPTKKTAKETLSKKRDNFSNPMVSCR